MKKGCYSLGAPDPRWTYCSTEGGTCTPTGTALVAFGAAGQFYYRYTVSGSIGCSSSVFGGDPQPYIHKACFWYPEEFQ